MERGRVPIQSVIARRSLGEVRGFVVVRGRERLPQGEGNQSARVCTSFKPRSLNFLKEWIANSKEGFNHSYEYQRKLLKRK